MITRRGLLKVSAVGAAFSAAGLVSPGTAHSLGKTVHILSGFTPGSQDAIARIIAGQMTDYAASIVVEPRPGASGRIAVEAVKGADPDGSVILIAAPGFITIFPHMPGCSHQSPNGGRRSCKQRGSRRSIEGVEGRMRRMARPLGPDPHHILRRRRDE